MSRVTVNTSSANGRLLIFQSGSRTPDYWEKRERGEILPDLPYTMQEIHSEPAYIYKYTTWKGAFDSTIMAPQMRAILDGDYQMRAKQSLDAEFNELANGRRNKLLSKVKGQTLPLLMLYKERHETGKMVTKLLDDMIFFARNYKRPRRLLRHYGFLSKAPKGYQKARRWYKARKASHTIGDYYLQWRFGWRPLWNDVEDSLKANAEAEKKGIRSTARAGDKYHRVAQQVNELSAEAYGVDGQCVSDFHFFIKAQFHITDVTLATAAQIMDVPETLWDAMPWSFMIDRIVNVSKYLNLRNATAGCEFISGCESTFRRDVTTGISNRKSSRSVVGYPVIAITEWHGPPRVDVRFDRKVLTSFPQPTLEYPYKDFLDQKYWGDILSLINQKFHKRVH